MQRMVLGFGMHPPPLLLLHSYNNPRIVSVATSLSRWLFHVVVLYGNCIGAYYYYYLYPSWLELDDDVVLLW